MRKRKGKKSSNSLIDPNCCVRKFLFWKNSSITFRAIKSTHLNYHSCIRTPAFRDKRKYKIIGYWGEVDKSCLVDSYKTSYFLFSDMSFKIKFIRHFSSTLQQLCLTMK